MTLKSAILRFRIQNSATNVALALIAPDAIITRRCFQSEAIAFTDIAEVLTEDEVSEYGDIPMGRRREEFLHGRLCGKFAVRMFEPRFSSPRPEIRRDVSGRPCLTGDAGSMFGLSISHSDDVTGAVAFPLAYQFGLDVERVDHDHIAAVRSELTPAETELVEGLGIGKAMAFTIAWTVKESYSKALGVGLSARPETLRIASIERESGDRYVSRFLFNADGCVHSWVMGNYVLSLAVAMPAHLLG